MQSSDRKIKNIKHSRSTKQIVSLSIFAAILACIIAGIIFEYRSGGGNPLVFLLSLVPAWESRYTIPLALGLEMNPAVVLPACFMINLLVIPFVFIGMDLVVPPLIKRYKWANSFFTWFLKRTYRRKWTFLVLIAFTAVPLPVTGAYTATGIAYLFGMERKRAALVISLGVLIAGLITWLVAMGIISLI